MWKRDTNFSNRLLSTTNNASESKEHADESHDGNKDSTTGLRVGLKGLDGVLLRIIKERENLLTNEAYGVFLEGNFLILILVDLFDLSLGLFKRVLDIKGFESKCLGILSRVADVDIIEEYVRSHGPKLNTNATNLDETLDRSKVREVVRVGNLARSPFALVGRIVNQRRIPLALVVRIGLVWASSLVR